MNLTWKEIKALKGVWLIDQAHNNELVKVLSVNSNKIRLSNGATMFTYIFQEKCQADFKLAPDPLVKETMEERMASFFEKHRGEIRGLYEDKYWRNGGWNGLMDAISDVEKRHKTEIVHIDTDFLFNEFPGEKECAYDRLVKEYLQ